eukprot:Skav236379  [mRNA]  locus=scaffold2027:99097:105882:- [translate_table: standard]
MDQAKLRLPKWGYGKLSKSATKLYRPATHLMATWLHGFRLYLYLSDEDVKKNSETSIETLALSLQHLFDQCSSMALTIHVQQDNCYREGKNRFVMCFLLLLQLLGVCRFASLGFLRTCHSHEDVDQIFGQVARLLMGKRCDSASEMINVLEQCIDQGQPSEQAGRIRGSVAMVSKLDQVSCWKHFVTQLGVSFKGLRHVHYMRFCSRKDLGSDVLDHVSELEELGQRWSPHGDDVFLVTKRWLSDTEIQRAIAVVPSSMVQQIRQGYQPPAGAGSAQSPEMLLASSEEEVEERDPFALIQQRLSKLGYVVAGGLHNTAEFGLPQQRRRAWMLCILQTEVNCDPAQLTSDVNSFVRLNVSILAVAIEEMLNTKGFDAMTQLVIIQEMARLQGIGLTEWTKYCMFSAPVNLAALVSILANWRPRRDE